MIFFSSIEKGRRSQKWYGQQLSHVRKIRAKYAKPWKSTTVRDFNFEQRVNSGELVGTRVSQLKTAEGNSCKGGSTTERRRTACPSEQKEDPSRPYEKEAVSIHQIIALRWDCNDKGWSPVIIRLLSLNAPDLHCLNGNAERDLKGQENSAPGALESWAGRGYAALLIGLRILQWRLKSKHFRHP